MGTGELSGKPDEILGGNLRRTSIPTRGRSNILSHFMLRKPGYAPVVKPGYTNISCQVNVLFRCQLTPYRFFNSESATNVDLRIGLNDSSFDSYPLRTQLQDLCQMLRSSTYSASYRSLRKVSFLLWAILCYSWFVQSG